MDAFLDHLSDILIGLMAFCFMMAGFERMKTNELAGAIMTSAGFLSLVFLHAPN